MTETRAADLVARRLFEAGCRLAFGMPGGEVLTLVDALERAGIRFVLARHENAAGFMAEGVHQRTGAPGVLVATLGPGAMNGVNVIANAYQDRVPLIVLTGCVDADEALTYTHQVMDHQAVLRPITKGSFRLTAGGADLIADRAVSLAGDGRSGPVHIDVPISVAGAASTPDRVRRRAPPLPAIPAPTTDWETARAWLSEAQRPLLVAGLDAVKDDSGDAILRFARSFGTPVITTYKAKGLIPEDLPLALGGAGLSPVADRALMPLVTKADLIVLAGYDPIEMRQGWTEAWDPAATRVIDIAHVPNDHYVHQAGISVVGHIGRTLDALSHGIVPTGTAWPDGDVPAAREALARAFPGTEPWGAAAIIDECRRCLPPETIATVDSGAHRILLSQMWRCSEPRTLLQSTGFCTMGCAVPLALGVSMVEPDRPVVGFSGDGGMLMVAGELSTAADLGLRTIFVVFVDESLALIEMKQRQRQLPNAGVDLGTTDFAALARAFGGNGFTVESRSELRDALDRALSSDRFTLIAARIGRRGYDGLI